MSRSYSAPRSTTSKSGSSQAYVRPGSSKYRSSSSASSWGGSKSASGYSSKGSSSPRTSAFTGKSYSPSQRSTKSLAPSGGSKSYIGASPSRSLGNGMKSTTGAWSGSSKSLGRSLGGTSKTRSSSSFGTSKSGIGSSSRIGGSGLSNVKSYPRSGANASLKNYGGSQFIKSGSRSGGHLGIRIGGHGHDRGYYRYYRDHYGHSRRYYSYCGYYGYPYYGYHGYYGYRHYDPWTFGFGFHYSSYPAYAYDPWPVVYTTPTYFITQPVQVVQEPVYVETPVVVGSEATVGYGGEMPVEESVPAYTPAAPQGADHQQQIQREMRLLQPSQPTEQPSQPETPAQPDGQTSAAPVPPPGSESRPAVSEEVRRLMTDGVKAFADGRYEEAAEQFLRVAMDDPNSVDAALAYATARFATGSYAMSAVAIRRGIRRMPQVVNSLFDIRDRYDKLADFDLQLETLTKHMDEHPDDVDGLVVLGFVQHFTGERELAAQTFARLKAHSDADTDVADIFLNAKPIEELLPAEAPNEMGPPATATQPATE